MYYSSGRTENKLFGHHINIISIDHHIPYVSLFARLGGSVLLKLVHVVAQYLLLELWIS
jgi:hypothetical protein